MWGWVKIKSWHRVKTPTRVPDTYVTFCGKRAEGQALETFPSYEKTCESCLRLSNTKLEEPA